MTTRKTFGWFPDASLSLNVEPSVSSAKMGDGYEQRAPNSITPILEAWELKFTGTRAEIKAIDDFLREHGGYKGFIWVNPDEVSGVYLCRSWKRARDHGTISALSGTFEQLPEV
ncbi:phage tail protein [Comamonas thiooxydans]|uniref:phage tail protein n=1 Tax=Comamonas thiooxydans TaxID=363952 RepID=UPI0009EDC557|nr:phage tail protein [Comamonas thiooxydans]